MTRWVDLYCDGTRVSLHTTEKRLPTQCEIMLLWLTSSPDLRLTTLKDRMLRL